MIRCWIFGHNWSYWFTVYRDDWPRGEWDDDWREVRKAFCTRCRTEISLAFKPTKRDRKTE